jgi:hypothetical protein
MGQKAFQGEDVTDIIAAVVRADPDWSALPDTVPEHIRALSGVALIQIDDRASPTSRSPAS